MYLRHSYQAMDTYIAGHLKKASGPCGVLKWLSQAVRICCLHTTTSLILTPTRSLPHSSQRAPALALWFPITQSWLLLRPLPPSVPPSQFLSVQTLLILQGPAEKKKLERVVLLFELPLHFRCHLQLCATYSSLACITGRCAPGLFSQANSKLSEGRTTSVSLQHQGQLPANHSCKEVLFIDFYYYYFKSQLQVFKREIASIPTLVWNLTDSQMNQAIQSVSGKTVFMGELSLIFVKCFQTLCREPIIPFQHCTWKSLSRCFCYIP